MRTPLRRKTYGLNRVGVDILTIIRHYLPKDYNDLTYYQFRRLNNGIRRIIQTNLLGEELLRAIAEDIIGQGTIRIDSPIYQYLKERLYHGNTRALLGDLQDALQPQDQRLGSQGASTDVFTSGKA